MKLFLTVVTLFLTAVTLSVHRQVQGSSNGDNNNVEYVPRVDISRSPCHVTTTEHDVIVDCGHKQLNQLQPELFPLNTTILYLDGNLLDSIPDGIFENCSQLQTLNLNNNKIKTIMPRAFLGLHKLENLDLGMNQLDICDNKSFSVSAIEQLDNLKVLDLLQNLPFDKDQYCYGFIGNIVSLTSLSIDTQGKHVYFGEEFQNLTKLEKLIITGRAEIITDDSFKYLGNLRYLDLHYMDHIIYASINCLVPLVKLDQLFMSYMGIGTGYTLSLLHPFVGKNMTTIQFIKMCLPTPWQTSVRNIQDGVLDSNKTAILLKICVSNFAFLESHLFYLDIGAFTSDTWNRCLQNLDLSANPWNGNVLAFYSLLKLKNLRSLVVGDNLPDMYKSKFPMVNIINRVPIRSKISDSRYKETKNYKFNPQPYFEKKKYLRNISSMSKGQSISMKKSQILNNDKKNILFVDYGNVSSYSIPKTFIWVSESLQFLDFSRLVDNVYMSNDWTLIGAKNIEYLDISESGFNQFTGKIEGLTGIKTLIASGNDMSVMSLTFFDTLTTLETLAIANCYFDVNFISTKGTRFLSSLKNLKRLDLSSNSLNILAQDMFQINTNLTELCLSANRFSEIPFSMTNTPKLSRLDIRYNAFTTLLPQITDQLDMLAHKWGKFELFLDGNILSCACQNIKFLQWLRLTAVTLDRDGNFTCINEQGVLTYTDVYIDLESFWRQCWGQFFFYVSLILFSVIAIGFLCAFVINKYRTYIVSQLFGIFFGFRQHLPGDYKIGVFFAYEDMDYQFVTGDLKRFVEQRLGMSTYIRHRDLDPGVVLGEAIAEAIASCWRTVIIINKDFQDSSEYFQFTCRSAVSMINLANPFRVLVLITERYRHRIPRDILSAIQEDNIVVVERFEINGMMQDILRNRITK